MDGVRRALIVGEALHALVAGWAWLAARPNLLLGATLVLAGAFQFCPLKNACLTACRIATGIGSLVWMVGLTAVMVIEKTARRGARLVVPVGAILLVAGTSLALSAVLSS